jgi:predicted aspartyl protease
VSGGVRGALACLSLLLLALAGTACVPARGPSGPGWAGACGPVRIGELPIVLIDNVPLVDVEIDGVPAILVLDTGAQRTVLTPAAVARLGLPLAVGNRPSMHGLYAAMRSNGVAVQRFSSDGIRLRRDEIVVAAVVLGTRDGIVPDGVLGMDTLSRFDLDLDLPDHRLILYRRQSCQDAAPAWRPPYIRVSGGPTNHGQPVLPVTLDGRRLFAIVDSGSQRSIVGAGAAAGVGVDQAALARDRRTTTHDATGEAVLSYAHRFTRLVVGADVFRNPLLVVTRIPLANGFMVLGSDFLHVQRLWISFGSQRIFLWRGRPSAVDPGAG